MQTIALLSTGDEIVNGDILNTNSQVIAQHLFDVGIQPGLHLTVNDNQDDIEKAIRFLLTYHAGLIITGGLGPTSDDRTRYALSRVLNTALVFDERCWQWVVERLTRLSLPIPDTNRQQCLFPKDAVIFHNDNGTAAACRVTHGQQPIFMLPGPPFECLPIFEREVLPDLQASGYARPLFRCQWLLLGVSEGSIAKQLDPLAENSDCYLGYRINPPYLEIKLQSTSAQALEKMRILFETLIGAQSISTNKQKASTQLKQWIVEKQYPVHIEDQATGGLLMTTLLDPSSYPYLCFTHTPTTRITLSGLTHYWHHEKGSSVLKISIHTGQNTHHATLSVPFRKERTPLFAVEIACWEIFRHLQSLK